MLAKEDVKTHNASFSMSHQTIQILSNVSHNSVLAQHVDSTIKIPTGMKMKTIKSIKERRDLIQTMGTGKRGQGLNLILKK